MNYLLWNKTLTPASALLASAGIEYSVIWPHLLTWCKRCARKGLAWLRHEKLGSAHCSKIGATSSTPGTLCEMTKKLMARVLRFIV